MPTILKRLIVSLTTGFLVIGGLVLWFNFLFTWSGWRPDAPAVAIIFMGLVGLGIGIVFALFVGAAATMLLASLAWFGYWLVAFVLKGKHLYTLNEFWDFGLNIVVGPFAIAFEAIRVWVYTEPKKAKS